MNTIRVDKWLWAVRVFKTRSLATDACKAGHVKIDGRAVKPAREIRPGEIISAYNGQLTRTVKMLAALEKRVSAKVASEYMEDLTSESERVAQTEPDFTRVRLAGKTRPSKKERRQLNEFKAQF